MALLGDFGGFNGSMVLFPMIIMSHFSAIMYKLAITKELPIRKKDRP